MKIVLLGSGNVATHLGPALLKAKHKIVQVWSRDKGHAKDLATPLKAQAITDLQEVRKDADLYIIAVRDDAILEVANSLHLTNQKVVHTSGSTDINILKGVSEKYGVIYPIQTFSKHKPLDFESVSVLVEGNTPEVASKLYSLASQISGHVQVLDSHKRLALHIAAVFACNFTNYLYTLSEEILAEQQLDFDLLRPLIAETAAKAQQFPPINMQTGPAVRNDMDTVNKHLEFLESKPELYKLYHKLTTDIMNFHHKV
jgi:predicted short-subunit dehydrogenase-like oxidoreductase (DUF2520 family)